MSTDGPFLLVIDPRPESAARVNGLLKDSGINVRILHADHPAEAERLTREFLPFLVYYLPESQSRFPLADAVRIAAERESFLAVALWDGGDALFEEAARSVAALGIGDEAQLPAITRRLTAPQPAITVSRATVATEAPTTATTSQDASPAELLLEDTREPVAFFHEGLHVAANPAYLSLMGAADMEGLAMVSLLEILERDGTDLKAMVRDFSRGQIPESHQPFTLRPPGQEPVPVDLAFESVRYDGEDCVQMRVVLADVGIDGADEAEEQTPEAREPALGTPSQPMAATSEDTQAEPQNESHIESHIESGNNSGNEPGSEPAPDRAPAPHARTQSGFDPLTGMYWRSAFMERLNERLATLPEDGRAAVFFITIDQSREQWEALPVADMESFVQATASELLSCLEAEDDICRFSDTRFALFAIRPDKGSLKRLGERLRSGIERLGDDRTATATAALPETCSVGLVLLDNQDHDPEHTLEKARAACRLAAEQGNRVMRYKPARLAGISEDEEAHWRERLRYAIENEDFYTVQHSIMNLDGDLQGILENRTFMHEDEADLPLAEFAEAAERNLLASQVDRLVIPGLLCAVAGNEEQQIIDISGNSLQDFSFPAWFQRSLQETRVPGKRIILQWPAWAARQQLRAAGRLIEELSPLGVRFSVSGFDADSKTLELLQALKLQFITLDRSLTRNLTEHPNRVDTIREIVHAAESVQVASIASDVPTSADLAMLWRGGVKLVSGEFIQETPRVIGQ